MADVQLKHGYVPVANRLLEAMIEAPFSERQLRVLLTLVRLTYGWKRRSVRLTELDLAERAGALNGGATKRAGGAFRSDLHELVHHAVIVRVDAGDRTKRGLMIWSINKDFATWGRFSIAPGRLAARWNPKPSNAPTDDSISSDEVARNQATSIEENWPESGPSADDEWPEDRPHCGPSTGHIFEEQR